VYILHGLSPVDNCAVLCHFFYICFIINSYSGILSSLLTRKP